MGILRKTPILDEKAVGSYLVLVDPVILGALPGEDLALLEPESNLLLSILDAVGAVAYVTTNRQSIVSSDGSGGGGQRVGSAKESCM